MIYWGESSKNRPPPPPPTPLRREASGDTNLSKIREWNFHFEFRSYSKPFDTNRIVFFVLETSQRYKLESVIK